MSAADFVLPLAVGEGVAIAYYALCGFGAVLVVASFIVQFSAPAVYGKFDKPGAIATAAESGNGNVTVGTAVAGNSADYNTAAAAGAANDRPTATQAVPEADDGGCRIPQLAAHILSDFPPGCLLFPAIFAGVVRPGQPRSAPSYVMLALWLAHYVHRGLIHPLTMRYSAATVSAGICLGGVLPNVVFSVALALHISAVDYGDAYFRDARFGLGVAVFAVGYVANRWADLHLRSLRDESKGTAGKYVLPTAGLFRLCYMPNYLGEFVEWAGFAILTSSLAGVLWALFGLSTFLPRALATRRWYLATFPDADPGKAALFPFLV
jgi:3-oxo-5-alpha-steroid 4-dehydrogenase 1